MTISDIKKLLGDLDSWATATAETREAFTKQMRGKQYGYEPLRSAWEWFLAGWSGRLNSEPASVNADGLLPCPFCGSTEIDPDMALGQEPDGNFNHASGCWNCGACAGSKPSVGEAVKEWNTRPTRQAWISVNERLPDDGNLLGIPYMEYVTDPILVIHADRPEYPITAHAIFSDSPEAMGVAIPTNGKSRFKYVCWYSAGRDLQNPFNLKDQNYDRYLSSRFGSRITHWKRIEPIPPQPKAGDV